MIDSHCHLDFDVYAEDLDKVIQRAFEEGIAPIITLGTDVHSSSRAVELCRRFAPDLFAGAGIHPHEAQKFVESDWTVLQHLWQEPEVVAVGETGLDFYYEFSPKETQAALFHRHLEASREVMLPVVIHLRDAFDEGFAILAEHDLAAGGVLHCFSGGPKECERALELGLYISFAGIVTFPKAEELQEAARMVPLERLLVETDAPYLAPMPHRGKRNEPAFVHHTAKKIAALRKMDLEELCEQTYTNTKRLFHLPE